MIAKLIKMAIRNPLPVLLGALFLAVFGVWSFFHMPIDAYPDISAQQVVVITTYPGRAAEEIERQVTIPIELGLGSVPNVETIRSRTIFGLSVIELVFDDTVDKYFARARVQEKLSAISLPTGVEPEIGPLATAYGEIYRYVIESDRDHSIVDLRTLNDWVVVPRLQRVPGVAEVINFGGQEKQYVLKLDPNRLERFGLSISDVIDAVRANNANAGGSVLRRGDMSFVIRGRGIMEHEEDLENTVINSVGGTPVFLRDLARVDIEGRAPSGMFGKDDVDYAVEGIVLMRRGENPSHTLALVKEQVEELNARAFPEGIRIEPFYDRQFLVDSTLSTVAESVGMGITLVFLVLLVFLGSPATALLVGLTIPFSLLFALGCMKLAGIPIGLLSIGAIDFGILVDGAVIMVDTIVEHVSSHMHADDEIFEKRGKGLIRSWVLGGAVEVERPISYSMLMIICAYFPLLTLSSIEGLLFRPMALTVIFALIGSVIFTLLVIPVIAVRLFRKGFVDWENPILTWLRPAYAGIIRSMLQGRHAVFVLSLCLLVVVGVKVVPNLGFDFLPTLDEGVMWIRANCPEGLAIEETNQIGSKLRSIVSSHPDVAFVTSQAGRNDSGTDPFLPSRLEMMVGLKPMNQWQAGSKREIITALGKELRSRYPTIRFNFTQPIIDSVTEATNGTSANLAVEFSGDRPVILQELARQTVDILREVPGAIDVAIEQEGLAPQFRIEVDRARCARFGVKVDDVNRLINTALGGEPIDTFYENDRRFGIVSRFDPKFVTSPRSIGLLPVFNDKGVPIPLESVARFTSVDGETMIARENSHRRMTVRCDIVGRDQGGFVADAKALFAQRLKAPDDIRVRWIGMFENLERASKHFAWVIPVTLALVFVLLVSSFGRVREAAIVMLCVPFACVGGVLALYVRGMTLNVSSGVGFAALFGVSIMNGVVILEWITELRKRGLERDAAILAGVQGRLRPVLMASLVAILGLLPASVAKGLGSDVQRPLATVIVWGLTCALTMTLFILPVFYRMFGPAVVEPGGHHGHRPEGEVAHAIENLV
jgi:cobalt-zinc-cadmium resistance protein CzcA